MAAMIVAELAGGLGNQMFQYAACRAVADRLGVELGLDLRKLRSPNGRAYGLGHFNIRATELSDRDLRGVRGPRSWRGHVRRGPADVVSRWWHRPAHGHLRPVIYQDFPYSDVLTRVDDGTWLSGFWQSERYFADIGDRLRADLTLKTVSAETARRHAAIQALDYPVAVHVRRSDYARVATTRADHGLCSTRYYDAAMSEIRAREPSAWFVFFSDEPEWVRTHLRRPRSTVLAPPDSGSPHEDLYLMTRCRAQIIANSSFSWWGAWLAPRPSLVIAPKRWMRAHWVPQEDIVPRGWLRV
jgi:hypothetical protein